MRAQTHNIYCIATQRGNDQISSVEYSLGIDSIIAGVPTVNAIDT